jgi:hypothetical protein
VEAVRPLARGPRGSNGAPGRRPAAPAKHAPLNAAQPRNRADRAADGGRDVEHCSLEERLVAIRRDDDPVTKTLARERLKTAAIA